MTVRIIQGDCREEMKKLADASVDSIVTDPPYHLTTRKKGGTGPPSVNLDTPHGRARVTTGFMGMTWDGGDIAHDPALWRDCLRVAKPGAWLLAFGGTRTYHRLACAIEDAGWELRDSPVRGHMHQPEDCPWLLGWMFGSGFPKSKNGPWGGTALKPAWEPIVCARKPLVGTVDENWREHGTGAMNIDACRIDGNIDEMRDRSGTAESGNKILGAGIHNHSGGIWEPSQLGRWPANLIHDGSDEVLAAFPDAPGQQRAVGPEFTPKVGTAVYGDYGPRPHVEPRSDTGSAARFFYCAKASRADRNVGCDDLEEKPLLWSSGEQSPGTFQAPGTNRSARNNHPTVKPTELMRWLVRLVTPKCGTVLDPFAGSGSTGRAADIEGFGAILIELDPEYAAIARKRIDGDAPLFANVETAA